ncbi:hypothetical protein LXL04_009043 [Taraxacum kok-saghyz]
MDFVHLSDQIKASEIIILSNKPRGVFLQCRIQFTRPVHLLCFFRCNPSVRYLLPLATCFYLCLAIAVGRSSPPPSFFYNLLLAQCFLFREISSLLLLLHQSPHALFSQVCFPLLLSSSSSFISVTDLPTSSTSSSSDVRFRRPVESRFHRHPFSFKDGVDRKGGVPHTRKTERKGDLGAQFHAHKRGGDGSTENGKGRSEKTYNRSRRTCSLIYKTTLVKVFGRMWRG